MRKYSYTMVLGLTFVIAFAALGLQHSISALAHRNSIHLPGMAVPAPPDEIPPDTEAETNTASSAPASLGNFADALFIGDSRTMGLWEYGDLGQADIFASSGMSVFQLFDTSITCRFQGENTKKSLDELLSAKQYQTVYVMLGINELGYPYESVVKQYEKTVSQIRTVQPTATIYLQANLHVTQKKSQADATYSNDHINQLNQAIAAMANGADILYLDVNPLFDDGKGNLADQYTSDQAHVLGKYYMDWTDWLRAETGQEKPAD